MAFSVPCENNGTIKLTIRITYSKLQSIEFAVFIWSASRMQPRKLHATSTCQARRLYLYKLDLVLYICISLLLLSHGNIVRRIISKIYDFLSLVS